MKSVIGSKFMAVKKGGLWVVKSRTSTKEVAHWNTKKEAAHSVEAWDKENQS